MKKLNQNCMVVVKYQNPDGSRPWVCYRANKGRSLEAIQRGFSMNPAFRFLQIYSYDRKSKLMGSKLGYIDRRVIDYL